MIRTPRLRRRVNDGKVLRVDRALEANYLAGHTEGRVELVGPMVRTYVVEAARPPKVVRAHAGRR
jgi:hypothetical protein